MTLKFLRRAELKIYTQRDFDFTSAQVYTIRDLDMDFSIISTRQKDPNTAQIVIYNLSEQTKNILTSDHQAIEFFAGYGKGELPLVFRGFTFNVQHPRDVQDPNRRTIIYAGDGQKQFDETRINRTYDAGVEYRKIVEDMAALLGIPLEIDYWLIPGALLRPRTFNGRVRDELDKVATRFDLDWSIMHNSLQIRPIGSSISTITATVLKPSTGLMHAEVYERQNRRRRRSLGLRVYSLLEPTLFPGRPFTVENSRPDLTGLSGLNESRMPEVVLTKTYVVDTVQHIGSTRGDQFDTIVDADARVEAA
jgi:hypothetical protein